MVYEYVSEKLAQAVMRDRLAEADRERLAASVRPGPDRGVTARLVRMTTFVRRATGSAHEAVDPSTICQVCSPPAAAHRA